MKKDVLSLVDDQISDNRTKTFHVTWFDGELLLDKYALLFLSDQFIK
jgi:hypothetical protein